MKQPPVSRRDFLQYAAAACLGIPLSLLSASTPSRLPKANLAPLAVHVFSKHLQFLNYIDLAAASSDMGFAGVDLTVRPGGHILPERVETDLPNAVAALRTRGLEASLMTTAITDATDPVSRKVLETAAKQGIQRYRTGWLHYAEEEALPVAMVRLKAQMQALAKLNAGLGLEGCYQNHAGPNVGASMWEVWALLEEADARGLGCQYDIRHATVEGGLSWPTGLRLVQSRIKTIVLKDFVWDKRDGVWQVVNTPLGEGMVDFTRYFQLLKQYGIQVPASLHLEYDLGGAEHGHQKLSIPHKQVFEAMHRDLEVVQELWAAA